MARVALGGVTLYDIVDGSEGSVTYSYDSTSVGAVVPTANVIGDTLVDLGDGNRMYIAESAGADEIKAGEWVEITATADAVGAAPGSIMFNDTEINGGLIRTGTVEILSHEAGVGVADTTNGPRMIVTPTNINIYDSTGLRIQIGQFT